MTPDPANAGASPANPQSWNGYSYALNNPATFTDPTGLDPQCQDVSGDTVPCPPDFPSGVGGGVISQFMPLWNGSPWGEPAQLYPQQDRLVGSPTTPYVVSRPGPQTQPQSPTPQAMGKKGLFTCASDAAENVSIAADL